MKEVISKCSYTFYTVGVESIRTLLCVTKFKLVKEIIFYL